MKTEEILIDREKRADFYRILSDRYYLPDEEILRIDYSRLFLGPYKPLAPPYGSIYLEEGDRIMGDSTMDAKNRYREEGLDICLKEAPDHIIVELEFMYFLIFKEIEALNDSDLEKAAGYQKKQVSFLDNHLGRWLPEFAGRVKANARTQFYKNLAQFTKAFIEDDLKKILDRI